MRKLDLKAVARTIGTKIARRKLDPEITRAVALTADEIKHNLQKAIENGKLQAERAVVVESNRLRNAVKAEFARHEPLLMEMVQSSVEAVQKTLLADIEEEHAEIRELFQTMLHEASDELIQNFTARTEELRKEYEAEIASVRDRCEQRLRAVEAAVIDACNLQNTEKERRIAALREFMNEKEQEVRMAIEDEAASAKAKIQQLTQQRTKTGRQLSRDYWFRWVSVEERSTGRTVQVLASADGKQLYCGGCGGSTCKHALKVAEALNARPSNRTTFLDGTWLPSVFNPLTQRVS